MKVILMHGKDATPDDKWYPWFKKELEKKKLRYIFLFCHLRQIQILKSG